LSFISDTHPLRLTFQKQQEKEAPNTRTTETKTKQLKPEVNEKNKFPTLKLAPTMLPEMTPPLPREAPPMPPNAPPIPHLMSTTPFATHAPPPPSLYVSYYQQYMQWYAMQYAQQGYGAPSPLPNPSTLAPRMYQPLPHHHQQQQQPQPRQAPKTPTDAVPNSPTTPNYNSNNKR
jgi:hypothetical protein